MNQTRHCRVNIGLLGLALVNGCAFIQSKVPGSRLNVPSVKMAPIQLEYEILGEADATANRDIILGIPTDFMLQHEVPTIAVAAAPGQVQVSESAMKNIPILGKFLGGSDNNVGWDRVEKEAIWQCLQKFPEADGLIAVRTTYYEKRDFKIVKHFTATVKGMAIKIKGAKILPLEENSQMMGPLRGR